MSHFQSRGDGKLSDGQLSALLVVRSCDVCCWTVFKCYKYKNTTFWNLTAVCQFSLFVCAALIDFRKRRSFVWFLLEKLRKPQKFKVLAPWLSPKLSYSFFSYSSFGGSQLSKTPLKIFATDAKNAENRTIRINFYDGRKFQRLQTYKTWGRI